MEYFNYQRELVVSLMTGGATPDAIEVMGKITSDMLTGDFRIIYEAIQFLNAHGDEFTPVEVSDKSGIYLSDIAEMCKTSAGSPSNIKAYAKRVRQGYLLKAAENELQGVLKDIKECDHESKIGEISERLESAVRNLVIETDSKTPRSAAEILENYIDIFEDRYLGGESENRLRVSIPDLDEKTQGFNRTDLIILAGAPGMGKTEFMVKMINGCSTADAGPLVFSMEMDEYQLIERSIAIEGNLPISAARSPRGMPQEIMTKFTAGIGTIKDNRNFFILDQAGLSVSEICATARRHKTRYPKTNMICIDYVGLIKLQKADRHDIALGDVSRSLKTLAKELKTPVVLLAQITSKDVEKRTNKRPMASDLKDSSRLQDDADWIIFPYRDEKYNPESSMKGIAEIIIAKARHGTEGTVYMKWENGHFLVTDQESAARKFNENVSNRNDTASKKGF